ncbi:Membrane protein [Lysobacter dokdonensis DS-58]|uniref:Membrane protein n=1 Tax=Lysobacter dokdonensis DS-58 TaxID=1300345 RepID=A0A0A2X1B6_9GAMM|nr:helix-turn-helix domain-containing protein [Lysobacter dokdonensis]KGQ19014.1 Membrane protein [Lysobacter dokdonensis DS-58]
MNSEHDNAYASGGEPGVGERLRKARIAAGLSIDEVSARLKMPVRVVEAMESEDWKRLGAPVYVRGQLRSYSRLLGLVTSTTIAASGIAPIEPTPIVARSYTPRMARWFEQGKRRLVYIILTAALVVPAWLATKPHIMGRTDPATVQSLDAPLVGAPTVGATDAATPVVNEPTVVASMTPTLSPRPAAKSALVLRLTGDSWVQVQAPDGRTIEKGLLSAGTMRSYAAGEVGRVTLGNASAVVVQQGDRAQDLAPFQRANVARFTVSSDGSLAPVRD